VHIHSCLSALPIIGLADRRLTAMAIAMLLLLLLLLQLRVTADWPACR